MRITPPTLPTRPFATDSNSLSLKEKFGAELNKPRRGGAQHLAERRAADISVNRLRSEELRVIEGVERFQAHLKRFRIGKAHIFEERQVVIVHTGAVEKSPARGARSSQRVFAKFRRVEIRPAVAGIVILGERTAEVVRLVHSKVIDPVGFGTQKRIVAVVDHRHRKARAEVRDSGKLPSPGQSVRDAEELFEGDLIEKIDQQKTQTKITKNNFPFYLYHKLNINMIDIILVINNKVVWFFFLFATSICCQSNCVLLSQKRKGGGGGGKERSVVN